MHGIKLSSCFQILYTMLIFNDKFTEGHSNSIKIYNCSGVARAANPNEFSKLKQVLSLPTGDLE